MTRRAPPGLEAAAAHHRAGRLQEAARGYVAVLQREPDHVDALQLLGSVLDRLGHPEDALELLDRAVSLDRRHVAALINRSRVLRRLERHDEAAASARTATRQAPARAAAWTALAHAERARHHWTAAARAAQKAAGSSDSPASRALWAVCLAEAGEVDRAVEVAAAAPGAAALVDVGAALHRAGNTAAIPVLRQALARDPALPEAAAYLAATLLVSSPDEAATLAEGAARARPDWLWARYVHGQALAASGRPAQAVGPLLTAAAGLDEAYPALADVVGQLATPPADLGDALLALFARDDVDHQRLERAARQCLDTVDDDALGTHPLFIALLCRAVLVHPRWEERLLRLRATWTEARGPVQGLVALALQAWHIEHAWADDAEDTKRISALRSALTPLPDRPTDADVATAAALACYTPPDQIWTDEASRSAWRDTAVAPLIDAGIDAIATERRLAAVTSDLGGTDDAISQAVRDQYEHNPYPRLVGFPRSRPEPFAGVMHGRLPHAGPWPEGPVRILVAGCGTGRHALMTASTYSDAEVVAVDLSAASLGRAQRVAAEQQIDNVTFLRGDLLDLSGLRGTFDLVESVGVLHHLADPAAGLASLLTRVAPGGLVRLGLYSERARTGVVAARTLLAEAGIRGDTDGLREARRLLLALPDDHPARTVVHSPDFYSLSGLRDLVLHACEHRYTPHSLDALLQGAGLELLGWSLPSTAVAAAYRARFPDDPHMTDLARWDAFEQDAPRTFVGMYLVWCRVR